MRVHRANGRPESALGLDLWLNRVTLAALKAEAKARPSDAEREAAAGLSCYFQELVAKLAGGHRLPSDVIREKTLRHNLEEAFAGVAHAALQRRSNDPALLQRLADLLAQLAKGHELSRSEASDLLLALHELGQREVEAPCPPDLNGDGR